LDQIVIKDTREPSESDTDFLLRQFYGDYYKQSKPTKSLPTVYVNANREYEATPWEENFPVAETPSLDEVTVTAKREEDPLLDLPYSPITPRPPIPNVTVPDTKSPTAPKPAKKPTASYNPMDFMFDAAPVPQNVEQEPTNVVQKSPVLDLRSPLDIGFFDQIAETTKNTQDQPGVVKIASGGYMDILFPKQGMSMDEILRMLEGK
jgi:hypothetical protein